MSDQSKATGKRGTKRVWSEERRGVGDAESQWWEINMILSPGKKYAKRDLVRWRSEIAIFA